MSLPILLLCLALSVTLAGLAALYALWATGRTWPAEDEAALAARVVRDPREGRMPRPGMLAITALFLGVGAIWPWLLAIQPDWGGWRGVVPAAALAFVVVIGLRGVTPYTVAPPFSAGPEPFATRDRRIYGPVCLALALGFVILLARWYR